MAHSVSPTRAERVEYLKKHELSKHIGDAVNTVLLTLPADPLEQISKLLAKPRNPDLVDSNAECAAAIIKKIHCGEKTCASYIEAALIRIEETNPHINACIEVADKRALLSQANVVDAKVRSGATMLPLEGLPLVVKLNVNTNGLLTSASTAALQQHRPTTNASVWQRLADAGAICIAKTNMPELAGSLHGFNPLHGHCWNPYGLGYSPGGSSSGTAASIAAGIVPAGLGSDTMGSLRIPADRCGITGMRPSAGRYSTIGCVPLGRVDTPGPMGRSVADVALLDAVMVSEGGTGKGGGMRVMEQSGRCSVP